MEVLISFVFVLGLPATEIGYARGAPGIDGDYASLAALAGVSLLATAITVNILSSSGGSIRMIPPFGFGRTRRTDESGKISNSVIA